MPGDGDRVRDCDAAEEGGDVLQHEHHYACFNKQQANLVGIYCANNF